MTPGIKKTANGQFVLTNVRNVHPDLRKAVPFKNDPKNTLRFGDTVLIPKTAESVYETLQAEINKLATEKHKLNKLPEADSCLRDGDTSSNEALHGHWVLALYSYPNEKARDGGAPQVLDRSKKPIPAGGPGEPYSGCYVNVLFDLYAPNNWKKVSGGLKVVQFVADGEPIGASTDLSELPELPEEELGDDDI
jgi:hypothetical protein